VNSSSIGQSTLLTGAAADQVLLVEEEVYEGECPREIYCSRMEGLCEEETAVFKKVNVGRIESNLLHPTQTQTSEPDHPDTRSLKEAELSALINTNDNMNEAQKECLVDLLRGYMKCFTARPGRCNILNIRFKLTKINP
jgi:hypothetical protein